MYLFKSDIPSPKIQIPSSKLMNKIALFIAALVFTTSLSLANTAPRAAKKVLYLDLSTQTGKAVDIGQTTPRRQFSFSSGRLGYDTPTSPPEGWVMGKKDKMHWSNKYHCWMPWAVNLGIKMNGVDWGAYGHEGRIPNGGYAASHGCIRFNPELAEWIYNWAEEGVTRVIITGSGWQFLTEHFEGRHLVDFDPATRTVKGFKRNPDGTLTKEFIEYASQGKIGVCTTDRNGKPVSLDNGVLAFEFFDKPWQQGVPKAEFEKIQVNSVIDALRETGVLVQ